MNTASAHIRWFEQLSIQDVALVGGKNASLGEMYRQLSTLGINVPNGFAITAPAYSENINEIKSQLAAHLSDIQPQDVDALSNAAAKIRALIYQHSISQPLAEEIKIAYRQLQSQYGDELSVAVRSSATAEDLPSASFAGQHDSYLNIRGEEALIETCRQCFASLFTDRAISYRINNDFDHMKVAMSVSVMKMVRADIASSGVMFSLDTETGFKDAVFITAAYGLGENVVQGTIDPDEFYVHKPTLLLGHRHVLSRRLGQKQLTLRYASNNSSATTENTETDATLKQTFCISDDDVLTLADYAIKTEQHYSKLKGQHCPMDMEWAKDGSDGKLYLIQARPETVAAKQNHHQLTEYQLSDPGPAICSGRAIGKQIAVGNIRTIRSNDELSSFQPGEVLLADTTNPDWGPVMTTAAAIITNRGGRTCHAAIVARELGIPAVVGCSDATEKLSDGSEVTVSCAQGADGNIYSGAIAYSTHTTELNALAKPQTTILLNVGSPERAFANCQLPNDGVGLARLEFIINSTIQAHPMALLFPDRIEKPEDRKLINALIRHYASGADYFIKQLSEGVAMIAAAFYPKPVIVRLSDFKSNEYAGLIGGSGFEPKEENPMIGFRGAARYNHPAYEQGFALECQALKRVREDMGFSNVKVMVPFCRRVEEAKSVLKCMADNGLKRGENGLEIYVMCEIPNNVIQVDHFAELFDGMSIGSNDLTQLVLGVDRDSALVAFEFDERDPGVMEMIRIAVEGAHRNNTPIGFCGQAPSDFPEIAEFLVELGIDSISLNPDSVVHTIQRINQLEAELKNKA